MTTTNVAQVTADRIKAERAAAGTLGVVKAEAIAKVRAAHVACLIAQFDYGIALANGNGMDEAREKSDVTRYAFDVALDALAEVSA